MRVMFRRLLGTLCVLGACVALAPAAMAADHRDSPALEADPAADINDLFVFRSTDSDNLPASARTVFAMTVAPFADENARFSDAVDYEFVVFDLDNAAQEWVITCSASTPDDQGNQSVRCELPNGSFDETDFNDTTDGARNTNPDLIAFAGLRDDPFFFDLSSFLQVYQSLLAGNPDPTPLVDEDDDGTDTFAGSNTLAIVVDVRNSVFAGAQTLGVYARTVRRAN